MIGNYRRSLAIVAIVWLAVPGLAADRHWIAAGSAAWNSSANWSLAQGGGGGASVPGSDETAIFDGGGTGNCSLDVAVDVRGLELRSGYTGRISQGADTVTVGVGGYSQADGVLSGGSTTIEIGNVFTLTGGVFTNTSDVFTLTRVSSSATVFTFSGGTFVHNNGTLRLLLRGSHSQNINHTLSISQPLSLWDLVYTGGNYDDYATSILNVVLSLAGAGSVTVSNDFTMQRYNADPDELIGANGGTISVEGDVTVGVGAVGGTTILLVNGANDQSYTSTTGGKLPQLQIQKPADKTFMPVSAPNLSAQTFTLSSGDFTAPTGTLEIAYNSNLSLTLFTLTNGVFRHNNGTLQFNSRYKTSTVRTHTINVTQPLALWNLVYTGGNWDTYSSSVLYYDLSGGGAVTVSNEFTMQRYDVSKPREEIRAMNGTLEVQGDVTCSTGAVGGTTILLINGTNDQTYTPRGGYLPHLKIQKPAGTSFTPGSDGDCSVWTFTLVSGDYTAPSGLLDVRYDVKASALIFDIQGGTFSHNNGTLGFSSHFNQSGSKTHTIKASQPLTLNNLTYAGGNRAGGSYLLYTLDLTGSGTNSILVEGDFSLEATRHTSSKLKADGAMIRLQGNMSVGERVYGGTTAIEFCGANNQEFLKTAGTEPQGDYTIAKDAGSTLLLKSGMGVGGDLTWTGGSLDLSDYTLTASADVSISNAVETLTVAITNATSCGKLSVGSSLSGIDYAGLHIDLAQAAPAEVGASTYTVVETGGAFAGTFAAESFQPGWRGTVTYEPTAVLVSGLRKNSGTLFVIR